MTDRVLVAIVTHNSAEVIAGCIEGLAGLDHEEGLHVQIVVADNASSDTTVDVLRGIRAARPDIPLTIMHSGVNLGWGAGNNLAIGNHLLEPDYVLLCNPDAQVDGPNLRVLIQALKDHEPRGAIAVPYLDGPHGTVLGANPEWGLLKYFVGDLTGGKRRYRRFQEGYRGRQGSFEIPKAYASGALALMAFPALRDAGFFDERIFMFNDDIDVTRRILRQGHALIGAGDARGNHLGGRGSRIGRESAAGTSVASLSFQSELVFVEKWYGSAWARVLAAYRWYVFFHLYNWLRWAVRRDPIAIEPLRAPAGDYLGRRSIPLASST